MHQHDIAPLAHRQAPYKGRIFPPSAIAGGSGCTRICGTLASDQGKFNASIATWTERIDWKHGSAKR